MITRSGRRLLADPSRVVTQLFVPGQEGFDHREPRTSPVIERLLALDEDEVARCYADVAVRFAGRHRALEQTFLRHADDVADRIGADVALSPTRRLLVGATFTNELAIEGAALCNPSIVAHPDQEGLEDGALRFVMSVRGIGEGHRSTIGFRTGAVDHDGVARLDTPPRFATAGTVERIALDATMLRTALDDGDEGVDYVLAPLGARFSRHELDERLDGVQRQRANRRTGGTAIAMLRAAADRTYGVRFADETTIAERVLLPAMGAERQGLEDARFLQFVDDDGSTTYLATYVAYDGDDICQQLLETDDFRSFTSSPLVGPAAANKGLAIFPRRIGGRFAALSRFDRESNWVAFSDDLRRWSDAVPCQSPARPWEVLQLGNCGPPIETDEGWLVLTHGVGPMRTYSIGALLLDLDDPTRVIGHLDEPLLRPTPEEQDGYVPNVVYSCGALVHAGTLVLPYGISDGAIGIATASMAELLAALRS